MLSEEILTYIGMALVVLFLVYYVYKVSSVQGRVIEGLRNKKQNKPFVDALTDRRS